ncbi:MAG: Lipopolysaccharide assembly protein LapB [Pseudomonadota bacterium]|nr:Lipopolysaccharide assembly protein LapB [Pseudomonadota bacterium]
MNISFLDNFLLWHWALLLVGLWLFALWLSSRYKNRYKKRHLRFSNDYFQGLNYLLNDEQDKALEIFLQLVEVDWKTIDTGLALGNIFRRKGEIDKAIKLHHDLLSRPSLPVEYKSRILLELGRDYHLAGWLDRAEGLFNDISKDEIHACDALYYLMDIYQKEQEWRAAIDAGWQYQKLCKKDVRPVIAQFHCSLSEHQLKQNNLKEAEALATQALSIDAACVRASILLGEIAMLDRQYQKAIDVLQQVEQQNNVFLPLIIDRLAECYRQKSDLKELIGFLRNAENRSDKLDLASALAKLIHEAYGKTPALEYLSARMLVNPTLDGMNTLLDLKNPDDESTYNYMPQIVKNLLKKQPSYQCHKCGYAANTHYWLCPGCQTWSGMRPRIINNKSGLMYE